MPGKLTRRLFDRRNTILIYKFEVINHDKTRQENLTGRRCNSQRELFPQGIHPSGGMNKLLQGNDLFPGANVGGKAIAEKEVPEAPATNVHF